VTKRAYACEEMTSQAASAPTSSEIPGSLNPTQRAKDWKRLATEEFDVLVVGGGVTGVGCALDAVTRGLSVGLIEQRDLASGTSSRSSKLLHGGLRYLEQRDFALVREALHERSLLASSICPHLVRPVSFLLPLTHRVWQRVYYGAGVLLYELLALGRRNPLPRHRHLSRRTAMTLVPGFDDHFLVGAIRYYDAQIDDARHTLTVARTAARHGAAVVTSAQLTGLLREDDKCGDDRVVGATITDVETGEEIEVRATKVVNATGVWLDEIQDMIGGSELHVTAAKGVHIVVPREAIDSDSGLILRTPNSVLFVIPWGRHWLIGTTDTSYELDRAHPAASASDIDYILEHANHALRRPLTRADIVGVYAGLRPLVSGEGGDTARLSREHAVLEPVPGLISIAGGKYTTYRLMAADTIDMAADGLDRKVPKSCTDRLPLIGADQWSTFKDNAARLAREYELTTEAVDRLLWRHGSRVDDVLALVANDATLGEELPGGGYIAAEVVYAARHEGALHLDDVLARRMRISIENDQRGLLVAEQAAALMAPELGWNDDRRRLEVERWQTRIDAELAANAAPDDGTADEFRQSAIDSRGLADA
jgi:glycerol-3-phosphate dehydrogenase